MTRPDIFIPHNPVDIAHSSVERFVQYDDILSRPHGQILAQARKLHDGGDNTAKVFRRVEFDENSEVDPYHIFEVSYVLTFNEQKGEDGLLDYSKVRLGNIYSGSQFVVVNDFATWWPDHGRKISDSEIERHVNDAGKYRISTTGRPGIPIKPSGIFEKDPGGPLTLKTRIF